MSKDELEKIWDMLPPGYYDNGNIGQNLWHFLKFKAIAFVLPKNPKTLLDVGCADGYLLKKISALLPGTKIYGVDVSRKLIETAKLRSPKIKFAVADVHNLPFPNDKFDVILCTEVLEHLVSPEIALEEMKRVVKKGGSIIIELDSGNFLFKLIFGIWIIFFKGRVWRKAHLHSFNIKKLEKLFAKRKLTIEKKVVSHFGMAVTFVLRVNKMVGE